MVITEYLWVGGKVIKKAPRSLLIEFTSFISTKTVLMPVPGGTVPGDFHQCLVIFIACLVLNLTQQSLYREVPLAPGGLCHIAYLVLCLLQ